MRNHKYILVMPWVSHHKCVTFTYPLVNVRAHSGLGPHAQRTRTPPPDLAVSSATVDTIKYSTLYAALLAVSPFPTWYPIAVHAHVVARSLLTPHGT